MMCVIVRKPENEQMKQMRRKKKSSKLLKYK